MQPSTLAARRYAFGAAAVFLFSLLVSAGFPAQAASLKIYGTPKTTAPADKYYTWKPSTSGRDPSRLRFSVTGKPSWATLSKYSGTLYGVPTASQAGTYPNIVISVTDGRYTARLSAFTITVTTSGSGGGTTNRPPTISGTPPPQVMAGSAYSFKPTASDPDGDALTYTISGLPSWASLSSTGTLSGTPTASHVGSYGNIGITVNDGKGGSATLAAFTIAVVQVTNGNATVRWTPPTTNTNGTALTNLSGYRLAYGTTRGGPYASSISINNPSVSTYLVQNLVPGTYYFVVTARNSAGVESAYSGEASKTVQ